VPRDDFHALARHYERIFPYSGPAALLPLLDLHPGARLLDVGGGTARVATTLPADCTRVVLDASLAMLREGHDRGVLRCAGLAERLPFPAASFDRCLFVDSLHHLADQRLAAQEALRVLRPGGIVVVEEPDVRHVAIKLIALGERLLGARSRFLSPADMARLFAAAGAAHIVVHEAGALAWVVATR
jgi:ubiquinone/menaquinone biosynthesis C-methylase UbiE